MEVHILGCGDAMGSGGRLQSCFSVTSDDRRILVDCGASAMISIRRFGIDPNEVEAIVLTHLHGDHFGGIPFFLLDARHVSRRRRPLEIVGPVGTRERVEGVFEALYPGASLVPSKFEVVWRELAADTPCEVAFARVTPAEVLHPSGAPAYALRVEADGRTFAYSGDTQWVETLVGVARDADLFLCECSTYEPGVPYHLDYLTLAQRRGDLTCSRLLLGHLSGDMIERESELDFEFASEGQRIVL